VLLPHPLLVFRLVATAPVLPAHHLAARLARACPSLSLSPPPSSCSNTDMHAR
jgi:hypothetical protein